MSKLHTLQSIVGRVQATASREAISEAEAFAARLVREADAPAALDLDEDSAEAERVSRLRVDLLAAKAEVGRHTQG